MKTFLPIVISFLFLWSAQAKEPLAGIQHRVGVITRLAKYPSVLVETYTGTLKDGDRYCEFNIIDNPYLANRAKQAALSHQIITLYYRDVSSDWSSGEFVERRVEQIAFHP